MVSSAVIVKALDDSKMTARMLIVFLIASISYFIELYSVGSISSVLPVLIKTYHLTGVTTGLIITMAGVGAVIGAILSGTISDYVGRRYLFVLSTLIYAIGSLVSAYASNYSMLLLGRIVDGFGAGAITPIILTYVTEFVPARRRGVLVPFAVVFSVISIPVAPYIALLTIPSLSFRGVFLFGGIMGLMLAAVSFALLPESIRFLLRKGKLGKAEKLARKVVDPQTMETTIRNPPPKGITDATKVRWTDIFKRGYIKSTFGAYLIAICHGTAIFGLGGFAIAVWATYAKIFTLPEALALSALLGLLSPIGPIVTSAGLHLFKRRTWLMLAYTLMAITLGGISFSLSTRDALTLIAFTGGYNLVATLAFSALATYSTELFPTQSRAMGTGVVQGVNRFGGVYGPLLFGLYIAVDYVYVYAFAAVLAFVALVLVIVTAHETRNKSLERIESELRGEAKVLGVDE